jgi:hypothetical protein
MLHPSLAATAAPAGPPPIVGPSPSPAGKRRGNPDLGLAPRCGAGLWATRRCAASTGRRRTFPRA